MPTVPMTARHADQRITEDWRSQLRNAYRDGNSLRHDLGLPADPVPASIEEAFAVKVPASFAQLPMAGAPMR